MFTCSNLASILCGSVAATALGLQQQHLGISAESGHGLWWKSNWATVRSDSYRWKEPRPSRDPHFYMDQGLWDTWRSKCPADKDTMSCAPERSLVSKLEHHKWRVWDASEADVIIIPALLSTSSNGFCGDHEQNMRDLAAYLEKSPEWKKYGGANHMILSFMWKTAQLMVHELQPYLRNATMVKIDHDGEREVAFDGSFDTEFTYRRLLVMPYLSGVDGATFKSTDYWSWAKRPYSLNFVGKTKWTSEKYLSRGFSYHGYELRKVALKTLPSVFDDSFLVCTHPESCDETLPMCDSDYKPNGCTTPGRLDDYGEKQQAAKFGLFFRGDTSSSGHIYDILDAEAIPIIIDDGWLRSGAPFTSMIDWTKIALFIPEAMFLADPTGSVLDVLAIPEEVMKAKLSAVQRARKCLSWHAEDNRIADLVLAEFAFSMGSSPRARHYRHHGAICGF